MARSYNKITIVGNLGADPDVRTVGSGSKVANFSVATSRQWTDQSGQKQERTDWHRVSAWAGLAEISEKYLRKGSRVLIEGRLEYGDNGEEGEAKRIYANIVARELMMLDSPNDNNGGGNRPMNNTASAPAPATNIPNFDDDDDDDLPF